MLYRRILKILIIVITMAMASLTSCDDDNDMEAIYHMNYYKGNLNDYVLSMKEVNALIRVDKSNYDFYTGNQTGFPAWFEWEVVLIETEDSIVTLYLHLDELKRTTQIINLPNDEHSIKPQSTCYVTVRDIKNDTTTVYHPTHSALINAKWKMFLMKIKNEELIVEDYVDQECLLYEWLGIKGNLYGTLTCDDESKDPMNLNIEFNLY